MKRDWDLIRQILLACEAADPGQHLSNDAFPDVDGATLFQHVSILSSAGYLDARLMRYMETTDGGGTFIILGMTWDGHDLAAKMASDTWWRKIKKAAADKGIGLTFDVIKALAVPAAKEILGLMTDA